MSKELDEIKRYRKEKTLMLIEEHKDVVEKYELLFDKDLLKDEIENIKSGDEEKKAESESKYLRKLDEKTKGLKKIEESLDVIDRLEKSLREDSGETPKTEKKETFVHPTKKHAQG